MRIRLACIGTRPPRWVAEGFREYARRMPRACSLELVEIPAGHASGSRGRVANRDDEGRRLLASVPPGDYKVALDERGRQWSTRELANALGDWMSFGRNVSLLVGGAEGLSGECTEYADASWSLSRLTFPHAMVRVIVAEQIYRAWTILQNHPYHRD